MKLAPQTPAAPDALSRFLARFDAFCEASEWPPVRLSRALFGDDGRVGELRTTRSDVGVKRLARAEADLARLASEAGVTLPDDAAAQKPFPDQGAAPTGPITEPGERSDAA